MNLDEDKHIYSEKTQELLETVDNTFFIKQTSDENTKLTLTKTKTRSGDCEIKFNKQNLNNLTKKGI